MVIREKTERLEYLQIELFFRIFVGTGLVACDLMSEAGPRLPFSAGASHRHTKKAAPTAVSAVIFEILAVML